MADDKKIGYGTLSSYGTRKYSLRPGWEYYAEQADAERRKADENAKVVLKEKRMNAGSIHYTFSVIQKKNTKPYLRVRVFIEKINYRGTIVIFAPYVPVFISILREVTKDLPI